MNGFSLSVLAADRICYQGTVEACTIDSTTGSQTFEAHHEPFAAVLAAGEVVIREDSQRRFAIAVEDGLVRFENNSCIIVISLHGLS